jgi:formylglycine-generating enzyme required for sulfatase activity
VRLQDVSTSPHFREHADLSDPGLLQPASPAARRLLSAGPAQLAATVEDPSASLADRLAAGGVLALIGDPRVAPLPAMCAVTGARVPIGLPPERVAEVTAAWAHVGVEEPWIAKETPVHDVVLASYWIGTYPVTNREYRDFLADTKRSGRPSTWYLGAYPYDRANHPVCGVSAEGADAYAIWLSRRTAHPWRLPTESEWEYAAKGPTCLEYPWGDAFDRHNANTRETGVHTTTPVGAFPAGRSPFGALDMAGNVEEYVADEYRPYPGGPNVSDHLVESHGTYRVCRGGSFARFGDLARTRRRHGAFPSPLYPVGFRLATSVQPQPHATPSHPTEEDA